MNQIEIEKTHESINNMLFESHGVKMIGLGSYALDFKQDYVFLGFTEKGDKVKLGEIYIIGPDSLKYKKRFGKITKETGHKLVNNQVIDYTYYQLSTDGHRYSEQLEII